LTETRQCATDIDTVLLHSCGSKAELLNKQTIIDNKDSENKSIQRAQTSGDAKISTDSDPAFES